MTTSYDRVPYPTVPRALTHPSHLCGVARMFGLNSAAVEAARVLEIGCGDGHHLIACAATVPTATFVGIDLSADAIERGEKLIRNLGLTNVRLIAGDFTNWTAEPQSFDYIIADGVYSWIPRDTRDQLLAVIGRTLVPQGVAYLSYNVYPGSFPRRMLWEMMKFHARDIADPVEYTEKALEMVEFMKVFRPLREGQPPGLFDNDLHNVIPERDRNVLFHDELSPTNDPVYVREAFAHAREHGLRFVADVEAEVMSNKGFPPAVEQLLDVLTAESPERREQYYDFFSLRRFRQSLFTTADHATIGTPSPTGIESLFLSTIARPDATDWQPGQAMRFQHARSSTTFIAELTTSALQFLSRRPRQRFAFPEVLREALSQLNRTTHTEQEVDVLAEDLSKAWLHGLVQLHGYRPAYRLEFGDRPVANPLARAQLGLGDLATSQLFVTSSFNDPIRKRLMALLDGTRTVEQIGDAIYPLFPDHARPPRDAFRMGLVQNLLMLAQTGYLVE